MPEFNWHDLKFYERIVYGHNSVGSAQGSFGWNSGNLKHVFNAICNMVIR